MTNEELEKRIESLEQIMQAQGMMFTTHIVAFRLFEKIVTDKLGLEENK